MPEIFIHGLDLLEAWGHFGKGTRLQVLQPGDHLQRDGTVERRGVPISGNFVDQQRAQALVDAGIAIDASEAKRERSASRRRRSRDTDEEVN